MSAQSVHSPRQVPRHKKPWQVIKTAFEREIKPKQLEQSFLKNGNGGGGSSESQQGGGSSESQQGGGERSTTVLLDKLGRCPLYVKVIAAGNVLAADTNNLSDPYVVVTMGGDSDTTRVERKTLNPVWDETFVYSRKRLCEAVESGCPWVEFKVYDWDALSKDDFLGQAFFRFTELDPRYGSGGVVKLPLKGVKKKKEEVHGELEIIAWFGDEYKEIAMDICPSVGLLGAPLVLHHQGHCMMEEPLFSILCIKVLDVVEVGGNHGVMGKSPSVRPRLLSKAFSASRIEELVNDVGDGDTDDEDGDTDDSQNQEIGDFMYCRATLGRNVVTSHLVRKQGSVAPINDRLAFIIPLPILDRMVQIVIFRTKKSKNRGRATHVAQFSLSEVLPDLSDKNVDLRTAIRESSISLRPIGAMFAESKLRISVSISDLDYRRKFYNESLLMRPPGYMHGLYADQRITTRFQSNTKTLTKKDVAFLAHKTATEYSEYEENQIKWEEMQDNAKLFLSGAAERTSDKAVSWYDWAVSKTLGDRYIRRSEEVPESSVYHAESAEVNRDDLLVIPEPKGFLSLKLDEVHIPGADVSSNYFCVFKFENIWARTKLEKPNKYGKMTFEWEARYPVLNPAAILYMAVVAKPSAKEAKTGKLGSFVLIGKLRVRISTIKSNKHVSAKLVFLNERRKGGNVAGRASFNFFLQIESQKARAAGYAAPPFPKENYVHGTTGLMRQLNKDRRKLVVEWVTAANPGIPALAVEAIEDVENEEFQMSRLKTNFRRIKLALASLLKAKSYFDVVASWKYPWLSRAGMVFCIFTAYHPQIVILCFLLYLAALCYKSKPEEFGLPMGMEHDEISMAEADDTDEKEMIKGVQLEVQAKNPYLVLKNKYESVINIIFKVQTFADMFASFLERLLALGTWADPLATSLILVVILVFCVILAVLGFRPLMSALLCFLIRPPRMRSPWTPGPVSFFLKLPSRGDRLV
eukprot:jgi/Picsp_1/173/NSC_00173-R1_unc-13-like protein